MSNQVESHLPYYFFGELDGAWYLSRNGRIVKTWLKERWPEQDAAEKAREVVASEEVELGVPQLPYYNSIPVSR